ncbi:MAG: hypothetical protein LBU89_07645, partial [Fibromonadaceae bacterium]|nr:hypothetical protein [Fibromonadaceae bacterium]
MYKIVINAPFSLSRSRRGWLDHLGAPISRLIFSKEYHAQYERGHYPIDSFGTLDRTIDDFRESPLQSLTDWDIRIPSVYSSKDGSFQTVDLFYWLEDINEKNKKKFNLIGCEAVLLENDNVIYRGVVNSVANGTSGTTISIGESIGSPQIKKSDFPIALGNSEMLYWPVKFEKNETGQDIIKISDRRLKKKPQFFLKMEEDKFIPVSFSVKGQRVEFSEWLNEAIFISNNNAIYILENDVYKGESFQIARTARDILRPEANKDTPDDYVIGEGGNIEFLQAWHWRWSAPPYGSSSEKHFSLGRAMHGKQHYHPKGSAIRRNSDLKTNIIEITLTNFPISLAALGSSQGLPGVPFITGNPAAFLETSRTGESLKQSYPKVVFFHEEESQFTGVDLIIKFPELNLSSFAEVSEFSFACNFSFPAPTLHGLSIEIGNTGIRKNFITYNGWCNHSFPLSRNLSLTEVQSVRIRGGYRQTNNFVLIGFKINLKVRMPYDAGKLYASGEFLDSNSSNSGESLIPAMYGLLGLLELTENTEYKVNAVGELDGNKYGTIINNEAVAFRDKLRNLASESATLVRFSPTEKEFLVKSISRQFDPEITPIPLDVIVLENNMYDFRMESSHRDDILNGILISWGKNIETDKYEHSLYIDGQRILRDGEKWNEMLKDGKMGAGKWKEVRDRLTENFKSNVGIVKSIDAEWIMDWDGAELFAFNYLCWNCAHLRKAQIKCITSVLRTLKSPVMEESIDIGSFIRLKLPGYPEKLTRTTWVITGILSDLDNMVSTVELLEAWGIEAK